MGDVALAIQPNPGQVGVWELPTRSARHPLKKITAPFTSNDLQPMMRRLFLLYLVLRELANEVSG
jgi:hypothetical protein